MSARNDLIEKQDDALPQDTLDDKLSEAEHKAIDNLARYKFMNFGYWAAIWIHLNSLSVVRRPNPFRFLVEAARKYMRIAVEEKPDVR